MKNMLTPVSPGEVLDKLTILQIKAERIADEAKLENVLRERAELEALVSAEMPQSAEIDRMTGALREVNEQLWQIEDDIRDCERDQNFGDRFVRLARAVYHTNDRRAGIKKEINLFLGSEIVEEKSYAAY